jgi:hypothetical protein
MYQRIPALLDIVRGHARSWFETLPSRPVRASASSDQLRQSLEGLLPENGTRAAAVIEALASAGVSGTIASAGPRYFGFVVGGSLPAALAADWLVSTWDQNAGIFALSPLASTIEQITGPWLRDLAGLPSTMSFGFVTGGHMANFTSLACARHSVLRKADWDVEADGLNCAPPIEICISEESHYTILLALRLLGLGSARVRKIATDEQGRMRADLLGVALRETSGPCIVCAQAGNVNTGAFDRPSPMPRKSAAPGSTSTVRSDSGLQLLPNTRGWCAALSVPTQLPATRTSGSTFPMTAAWFSVLMKPSTAAPCRCPPPTLLRPAMSATLTSLSRKNRVVLAPSPSTPPSARSAVGASPK